MQNKTEENHLRNNNDNMKNIQLFVLYLTGIHSVMERKKKKKKLEPALSFHKCIDIFSKDGDSF